MTKGGPTRSPGPAEPIPLTVLTGFLGAGKTSLLNRLIHDPALAETAVIINELGEIGLDHLERWPDDDQRTRIVLIARDLSAGEVRPLFDAFLNRSAPDRPDRAAVLDNPLIPFGGCDR